MMYQLSTRTTHRMPPSSVTITIAKLIRLLFLVLLLSGARVAAQTKVAALRDYHRVSGDNRDNPRGFYFEDQHHDLDKFAGEWEGAGFGGHQWSVRIVVLKKANYYHSYWSDALGLELSIAKDGKACITPTKGLLSGTSFIKGWEFAWDEEKDSVQPDVCKVPFAYGKADKPYQGIAVMYLHLNAAHDTIVVRRKKLIGIDCSVIIPDYLSVPYDAEVCTLRRVKK